MPVPSIGVAVSAHARLTQIAREPMSGARTGSTKEVLDTAALAIVKQRTMLHAAYREWRARRTEAQSACSKESTECRHSR